MPEPMPLPPAPAAAVLLTGNELLDGRVRDRNGAYLTADLACRGLQTERLVLACDDQTTIANAVSWLLAARPRVLVVSGGLGTTHDDLTAAAVGQALEQPLSEDPQALAWVEARTRLLCERRDLAFESVFAMARRQAILPAGSRPLAPAGAAPGFTITHDDTRVVVLPGVPRELEPMWQAAAADLEREGVFPGGGLSLVRIYGVGELQVSPVLECAVAASAGLLRAGITAGDGEITVALRHDGGDAGRGAAEQAGATLAAELPVYSRDGRDIDAMLADGLRARGETIAVAESCTGGSLGARFTARPGSSDYFVGGVISYADEVKSKLLGVPVQLLAQYGAVSEPVAAAMAAGVAAATGATWGIGITGIAGPDGGSAEKPVGLVYIGCVGPVGPRVERHDFSGDREGVRNQAVTAALHALRRGLGL